MTDLADLENAVAPLVSRAVANMTHEQLMELVMPCGDREEVDEIHNIGDNDNLHEH